MSLDQNMTLGPGIKSRPHKQKRETLGARMRTNNKFNPHIMPGPGISNPGHIGAFMPTLRIIQELSGYRMNLPVSHTDHQISRKQSKMLEMRVFILTLTDLERTF